MTKRILVAIGNALVRLGQMLGGGGGPRERP